MNGSSALSGIWPNRSDVLFFPVEGGPCDYKPEDKEHCFSQQPIERLPEYLFPRRYTSLHPPMLHRGWIVNSMQLLEYTLQNFPDALTYVTEGRGQHRVPCIISTLSDPDWIVALLKHLDIPESLSFKVQVTVFRDAEGDNRFGLSMGHNYIGTLDEPNKTKLREALANGEPELWYLDRRKWMWTGQRHRGRRARSTRSSTPSTLST